MVRMIRGGARQIGEGHLFLMLALAGLPFFLCAPLQAFGLSVPRHLPPASNKSSSAFSEQSSALPEIQQVAVAGFPPETQEQFEKAYAQVRRFPRDAEAVGKMGMLLDLYHHPVEAVPC